MGIIDKVLAVGESDSLKLSLSTTGLTSDNVVSRILTWAGSIAGVLVFIFLLYGGFMYLTAAGNAEQSKKGGQAIINAVIGLIIIALAYALTGYIVKIIGTS